MEKFGKIVVKLRTPILILALLLMIPAFLGMQATRINYDMLTYLPADIDTVEGQNILMDEFGKGAFSFVIVEGMNDKDISSLRQQIEEIPHVDSAIWYDSFVDLSIPKAILPQKLQNVFVQGDSTIIAVFFDTSSSADETIEAIEQIRSTAGKQCFVSGISALVTDLKALAEREGIDCVLHDGPKKSDTIHAGLSRLEPDLAGYLFMPGDQPLVRPESLRRMAEQFSDCPEQAVRLGFDGTAGSPVLFPAFCRKKLMAYTGDRGGIEVLKAERIPCSLTEAAFAWELWDADTPEHMEKIREAYFSRTKA